MGKGSKRRPSAISREEENLRWLLAEKKITFVEFETRYNRLLREGKITRNGRMIGGK